MRAPRVRLPIEWVEVRLLRPRIPRRVTLRGMLIGVAVLALMSKSGVWLYRQWPGSYMLYIRIEGPGPGPHYSKLILFDTRNPAEAAAMQIMKADLTARRIDFEWGRNY